MAQVLRQVDEGRQLALYGRGTIRPRPVARVDAGGARLCAGCRAREARYGFRDEAHPHADRPQTLCFDCFRMEIARRQSVAAQLARGWDASQARLPLQETLRDLSLRRRRAQIAARHALDRSDCSERSDR